jgi:prepilin-type N-terminal cleavage/methylation domain-containing protein
MVMPVLPAERGLGDRRGFTLLEIAVGLVVLALAVFTFTAYASGQRKGLNRSNQLADGTRAAATALETLKGQLADSAYFKSVYSGTASRADISTANRTISGVAYAITVTIRRAPAPLYALTARARAVWGQGHASEVGLLYPGSAEGL